MAIVHPALLPEDAVPEPRRWSLAEFIRLDAEGLLGGEGEHYELLDGLILKKMGQNEPHIVAMRLAVAALRRAFEDEFDVNCQVPLHLGEHDSPEQDVTVLKRGFSNGAASE